MTNNPIDNGGPAFPQHPSAMVEDAFGKRERVWGDAGMSLRDWFAGQALAGLVAAIPGPGCAEWDYYSGAAFHIADAMLKARNGGSHGE